MSQQPPNDIGDSKRKIVKKNNYRQIVNLKALMDKRKQQRATTIYNLANSKFQNALIIARQLLFTSQKIWKQFNDQFKDEFEETYYFRTSKNKEHTQYLLDSAIICKIFGKSKKKDDILQIIEKIQIPQIQIIQKTELVNKDVIIRYNQMKQIQTRVCSALLLFIQVVKQEKILDYSQKLFHIYLNFVQKYFGQLQYATATFIFADFLFENKQYEKALQMFEICLKIRRLNCLNEAYVDVLVNSAICSRYLGLISLAIQRMRSAIEISKDLRKSQFSIIDDYNLFLAKLHLQNADYNEAYKNYKIVYKMRSKLQDQDPKKIQIELNLLYFYKMLQKVSGQNPEQHYNIKDRKQIENKKKIALEIIKDMTLNILNRQQFTKFDQFNKKMAHLTLVVSQPFFDLLNSQQVNQLNGLLVRLTSCSFMKGISEVTKCSFFQQKKTRQLLLISNPLITQHKYY